jgi:DNA-directed RNA polymerase subunit H (RpoH/RPB5)
MICEPYKCIFVHIPKAAGRSIEMFFFNRLGLDRDNEEHRRQLLLNDNDDPTKGTEKLSHLSAAEYVACDYISQQNYDQYYKFSFVRNPFSRLVSEYRYRNFLSHKSFKDFVMNKLPEPGWDDKYRHIMSQSEMLYDTNGNLLVEYVGKFENLDEDFVCVCEQLGFRETRLPHINSSDKTSRDLRRKARNILHRNRESGLRRYTDFYDNETIDYVARLYQADIKNFSYSFDDCA